MFSELFIKRPILATVCSLMIILAGAIAIPTLPIARYPDLTPPSVSVPSATVKHRPLAASDVRRSAAPLSAAGPEISASQ